MGLENIVLVAGHGRGLEVVRLLKDSYRWAGRPVVYASPLDDPLHCEGIHVHVGDSSGAGEKMLKRLLDSISSLLHLRWDVCVMLQYDQYVVAEPPPYPGGLACCVLGRLDFDHPPAQHFLANKFCGVPWMFDRETAIRIVACGLHLLSEGLLEGGHDDRFLGLICQRACIPMNSLPGTCCKWDQDQPSRGHDPLDPAAWIFHPVKTSAQKARIDLARSVL